MADDNELSFDLTVGQSGFAGEDREHLKSTDVLMKPLVLDPFSHFHLFVQRRCGHMTMVEFWRLFIDKNRRHRLGFLEFSARLRDVGYENVRSLYKAIVRNRYDAAPLEGDGGVMRLQNFPVDGIIGKSDGTFPRSPPGVKGNRKRSISPTDGDGGNVGIAVPAGSRPRSARRAGRDAAAPESIALRNFDSVTLSDLDPQNFQFIQRFCFELLRAALAVNHKLMKKHYAGRRAGETYKSEGKGKYAGLNWQPYEVKESGKDGEKDKDAAAKKDDKGKDDAKDKKKDDKKKDKKNKGGLSSGSEEEGQLTPRSLAAEIERQEHVKEMALAGDFDVNDDMIFYSLPLLRAKAVFVETFLGDQDARRIDASVFSNVCRDILDAYKPPSALVLNEKKGWRSLTYRKALTQFDEQAKSLFPLLIQKSVNGKYGCIQKVEVTILHLTEEDLCFAFELAISANPAHVNREQFVMQPVPITIQSPRRIGLKTTQAHREAARATEDILAERRGSPRLGASPRDMISPDGGAGSPRRGLGGTGGVAGDLGEISAQEGYLHLRKDVQLWSDTICRKFQTLPRAYKMMFWRARKKTGAKDADKGKSKETAEKGGGGQGADPKKSKKEDNDTKKSKTGKSMKGKDKGEDGGEDAGKKSKKGSEASSSATSFSDKAKRRQSMAKNDDVNSEDEWETLPTIFETNITVSHHQLEYRIRDFLIMNHYIFQHLEHEDKIHLGAVFWFLVKGTCPPRTMYNPISRCRPELNKYIANMGKKKTALATPFGVKTPVAGKKPTAEPIKLMIKHWDGNGYKLVEQFQKALTDRYGHVGKALMELDTEHESFRVDKQEFSELCISIGFRGNSHHLFNYFDILGTGFVRLDLFDLPLSVDVFGEDYLMYKRANEEQWLELKRKMKLLPMTLKKFQSQTLTYYEVLKKFISDHGVGNISRFWRKFCDKDGKAKCYFGAFQDALQSIGYAGNARVLFYSLARGDKYFTIDDAEPRLSDDFLAVVQAAKKAEGSMLKLLQSHGFHNVEQPISRKKWRKMLKSLKFYVAIEFDDGDFRLEERPAMNYYYLFDHLDIYDERRVFPDDVLAMERLLSHNLSLSELYAERTRALNDRQAKQKEQESTVRDIREEQIAHCKLIDDLKATRNCGKQQTEQMFITLERRCGSVLRAWITLLDAEKTGKITYEQLQKILKKYFGIQLSVEMWSFLDYKTKGFLTIDNFDPEIKNEAQVFIDCCIYRYGTLAEAFAVFVEDAGSFHIELAHWKEICLDVNFDGNSRRLFVYYDRDQLGLLNLSLVDMPAAYHAWNLLDRKGIHVALNDQTLRSKEKTGSKRRDSVGSKAGGKGGRMRSKSIEDDFKDTVPKLQLMDGDTFVGRRAQRLGKKGKHPSSEKSPKRGDQVGRIVQQFIDKMKQKYNTIVYAWRMLFGSNNEVHQLEFSHAIKNLVRCEYVPDPDEPEPNPQDAEGNDDAAAAEQAKAERDADRRAAQREAVNTYLRELWRGLFSNGLTQRQVGAGLGVAKTGDPNAQAYLRLELLDPGLEQMALKFREAVQRRYGSFARLFELQCFHDCTVPMDVELEQSWSLQDFLKLCHECNFPGNPRTLFHYYSLDCKHLYPRNLDYMEYDKAKQKTFEELSRREAYLARHGGSHGGSMASHGVSTDTVQKGRFLMNQHATANNEIGDEFRIGEDETGGGIQQAGFTMPKLTTLFSFLDHAERRGNLLGVWRKYFDPDGYGKVNFVQFSQAAKMLGFLGKPEAVWKELFGRLDFFGFVSNQLERKAFHDPRFLTFEKLDPFHFQMLEAFRKGLTMQFKKVKEAFGETRWTSDDMFMFMTDLDVRFNVAIPPPPSCPPRFVQEDVPVAFQKDTLARTHMSHFADWIEKLTIEKPKRMTRAQSDYLFRFLDPGNRGTIGVEEVEFLDGWWIKPRRKLRSEAISSPRVLRDPRRIFTAAKAAREEKKGIRFSATASEIGKGRRLRKLSTSSIDKPYTVQLTRDLRSHWNPRHHVVTTDGNKLDNMIFEMVNIDSKKKHQMKVQQKASEISTVSWVRTNLGAQIKDVQASRLERLQPRPPPIGVAYDDDDDDEDDDM